MTDKQISTVQKRILKYKKALANDKKQWGGFHHDGHGIRYIIPEQYLKINDYKGALRYYNWFKKAFPDDSCYPIFLFEWAFVLFKTKKLIESEAKICSTFFSNTYLLDKFLGKELLNLNKAEHSNWEFESIVEHFSYSKDQEQFKEFGVFVETVMQTRSFLDKANKFVALEQELKNLPVGKERSKLVAELYMLKYGPKKQETAE